MFKLSSRALRRIALVLGFLVLTLIGTGEGFDKNYTVAVRPGGVIRDIPNQMHYDGTGPEGATLEFIAMGPAARN